MLGTHPHTGLSSEASVERLGRYGSNSIAQKEENKWVYILLNQLKSPIIYLLLFAAGVSFWFSEWVDAVAILIVLVINTLIGFYMELQAERSMQALKQLSVVPAKVIRDQRLIEINSDQIVPGDMGFVEAGDLVPADGRIISLSQLQVDESPLTGESIPVEKQTHPLAADTTLAERNNMLYKGTYISKGNGYFAVTGTGADTELGKVASLVRSADQTATPLEKKLEGLSKKLIWITLVLVVLIFSAGLLYGHGITEMLTTSIALAVAAIPEGLPIVATVALAQGMIKMARKNVIVKQLSAVETLGGTSVICTDKTGTLTKNKIEVSTIVTNSDEARELIKGVCVLCNTADIYLKKELGDPLEIGLLKYAVKEGVDINDYRRRYSKISEEPFSSETKIMCTLHQAGSGLTVYAKGAAEELLDRCTRVKGTSGEPHLDDQLRSHWLREAERLASSGLRVIAAAYKTSGFPEEKLSQDLVFLGLIGMIDPPREEVFPAIQECRAAGIHVIMITGDHPATARNIAHQLRIADNYDAPVIIGKEMKDFEELPAGEKMKWMNANIFARVSPKQKLDLVSVLQENQEVVAMTGDGINDAPALKKADIGVAMGLRGTQVAQEVADMILKDDSFTSIVLAIRQGRIIFENIRKFVIFLLSCNLSELLVISIASVFNLHFQLFPLQILFINLVTDVLPALALGMTEGSPDIMKKMPRNLGEAIIDVDRWKAILFYSAIIGATSIGAVFLSHYLLHYPESWSQLLCNNILFFTLIFSQLLHVFNMGNSSAGFFSSEVFRNRYVWMAVGVSAAILMLVYSIAPLKEALSLHEMSAYDWAITLAASVFSLVVIQISKKLQLIRQ